MSLRHYVDRSPYGAVTRLQIHANLRKAIAVDVERVVQVSESKVAGCIDMPASMAFNKFLISLYMNVVYIVKIIAVNLPGNFHNRRRELQRDDFRQMFQQFSRAQLLSGVCVRSTTIIGSLVSCVEHGKSCSPNRLQLALRYHAPDNHVAIFQIFLLYAIARHANSPLGLFRGGT